MNSFPLRVQFSLIVLAQVVLAVSTAAFQTTRPKKVDKVELMSIDYEKGSIERVKETKFIEGKEAARVLRIWKQQRFLGQSSSACHQPAYAVKFYSKQSS